MEIDMREFPGGDRVEVKSGWTIGVWSGAGVRVDEAESGRL